MHRKQAGEAYVNPTYQTDPSEFAGQPNPTITNDSERWHHQYPRKEAGPSSFQYNEHESTMHPYHAPANREVHVRGKGVEELFIEPDYDNDDKNPNQREKEMFNIPINRTVQQQGRGMEGLFIEPDYYDNDEKNANSNQRGNKSKSNERNLGHDIDKNQRIALSSKGEGHKYDYGHGIMNNNNRASRQQSDDQNWLTKAKINAKSGSYPSREHKDSARNRHLSKNHKSEEERRTESVTTSPGWFTGLDTELEKGAEHENRRKHVNRKSHMTMKNAQDIAREIGMELRGEEERSEDRESERSSTCAETNGKFSHFERKCWSRQCWSKSHHSHVQRFLQTGGKANHLQLRLFV